MAKRTQPAWKVPSRAEGPVLRVYNSLTRQKEEFVPRDGRNVQWYSCGPTVYDAAHMGHARSYISFDILRRVLSDYFGYNVFYVMNITDIDDKIIKRARQTHLYDKYVSEGKTLESVLEDARQVMEHFSGNVKRTNDPDKKQMMEQLLTKLTAAVENLQQAVEGGDESKMKAAQQHLVTEARDPISDWLDSKYGCTITDNSIFNKLPRHYEEEFHKDMDALNVLRPDVLTRVSEYVPEIVTYIEKIIERGLAYHSNGSVYFNVNAFDGDKAHHYGKLVPEAYGDANSLQEGEGELSSGAEKRASTDFALWKRSRPGEPHWESPWGAGRPGWHIECSVMASSVCGAVLDIHTGGVDLKFPHHDNEIAQSEAYFGHDDWVRYFLHSGHLTISGCKMSKSLKNFVSIARALERHSARQLRFAFLMHSWKDTLDYSDATMDTAVQCDKFFSEFFLSVKDALRRCDAAPQKWTQDELDLQAKLSETKTRVHAALCDNIDTRGVIESLREAVTACNVYMMRRKNQLQASPLREVAVYVTHILQVFGACEQQQRLGFPLTGEGAADLEGTVMPYLEALAAFRTETRGAARLGDAKCVLRLCDELRDVTLPALGVRLEDRDDGASVVKLLDPQTLQRERQAELDRAEEKKRNREKLAEAQALKDAQRRIKPAEMFLSQTDKFSRFDEAGLPTHDHEGKELSKGSVKKLAKLQQAQHKKYQEFAGTN